MGKVYICNNDHNMSISMDKEKIFGKYTVLSSCYFINEGPLLLLCTNILFNSPLHYKNTSHTMSDFMTIE